MPEHGPQSRKRQLVAIGIRTLTSFWLIGLGAASASNRHWPTAVISLALAVLVGVCVCV